MLLDELHLGVDGLFGGFFSLVIEDLLLFKEVPAFGVDGDNQGAEFLAGPLRIGGHIDGHAYGGGMPE